MNALLQDLRYGIRMLAKNPGFTVVAVLTLALGIGANTAIFTVVNAVLLRPLPYPEPDRIVQFMVNSPPWAPSSSSNAAAIPEFMVWRELTQAFRDFAAYDSSSKGINLTGGDHPELLKAVRVSVDYFRLFGARVEVGRTFSPEEDRPGGPRLVVITDGLWRRRFGADRSLVGKAILLAGDPYVVIGVLGPGFASDPPAEIWLPLQADPYNTNFSHDLRAAARLGPGITLEMAKAQMKPATEQFQRKFPATKFAAIDLQESFTVELLRNAVVGDVRLALTVLLGAVSFVLLIASANIANLLLTRATGRRREMAIRAALGAGRRRIISQLLTESLLLSFGGGVLGFVLGYASVRALLAISPGDIPRIGSQGSAVTPDLRVLAFTLLISVFTGILVGFLPAFGASHADLSSTLNENGARSGAGLRQNKARSILVVAEMALSLVLLAGAALLIRTFVALRTVDPGVDAHNVLTIEMSLAGRRFEKTAAVAQLVREAKRRVESIPGVEALAATAISLPLEGYVDGPFEVEGRPPKDGQSRYSAYNCVVSPRYFEVFRIPLLRGRVFTERDDTGAPGVVLINEAAARQFWPKSDPVGERIFVNKGMGPEFEEPPRQIIGVVADVRDTGLTQEPQPILYLPVVQIPDSLIALGNSDTPIKWVVRTKVEPYSLRADIERELRIASGGLPVAHIRSMEQVRAESTARTNFNTTLLSIFAGLAMLLAAIGIYGVMSYAVGERVHEIGIRMALGARAGDVLSLVLRQGLSLALVGIAIGLFGATWLTEAMKSQLFGVSPNDPPTFAIVGVLLLVVATAATYIPARRATKVDPMVALRYE
jgi:putative ABC transport system permease protein